MLLQLWLDVRKGMLCVIAILLKPILSFVAV